MSNNVTGVKISQFNIAQTIDDASVIPFVSSATNLAISFANFKSQLGVTGTIKPIGSATSLPILSKPSSTVNYIRNILGAQGVSTTTAATGEILVKTNFANGTGGDAQSIVDPTVAQTKFRGLKAGNGITITQDLNNITITSNAVTSTSKTVIVSTVDDFPTAIGGVITLEGDTDYFIANDITTTNQFVIPNSQPVIIRGADSKIVTLGYSGVGNMFSGAIPNLVLKDIRFSCQSAKLLDFSAATSGSISIRNLRLSAAEIGSVGSVDNLFVSQLFIETITVNGLSFSGSGISVSINDVFISSFSAGVIINLDGAVFDRLNISSLTVDASGAGTVFMSGLANSANLSAGTLAQVHGITLRGSITNFVNIDPKDVRYNFQQCNTIQETRPDSLSYLTVAVTTSLTAATPAKVNGVFVEMRSSQMTASTNGRITYNGERSIVMPITATLSVEPTTGTNKNYNLYFAKNGTVITETKVSLIADATKPSNQAVIWQDLWVNSDYYEVFIESDDGTSAQVNTFIFRVD